VGTETFDLTKAADIGVKIAKVFPTTVENRGKRKWTVCPMWW
jgi:hypothetical protein